MRLKLPWQWLWLDSVKVDSHGWFFDAALLFHNTDNQEWSLNKQTFHVKFITDYQAC